MWNSKERSWSWSGIAWARESQLSWRSFSPRSKAIYSPIFAAWPFHRLQLWTFRVASYSIMSFPLFRKTIRFRSLVFMGWSARRTERSWATTRYQLINLELNFRTIFCSYQATFYSIALRWINFTTQIRFKLASLFPALLMSDILLSSDAIGRKSSDSDSSIFDRLNIFLVLNWS